MSKSRFAALDTSFLLALAAGDGHCEAVVDWLGRINVYALVTPTVLQEISDVELYDPDAENRSKARRVKDCLSLWTFLYIPLEPVQHGIAKIIASKLIEKGILPDDAENDGLVIAEASIQGCKILVTDRSALLAINSANTDSLRLALLECDVSDVFTISPTEIVEYIERDREESPEAEDSSEHTH